MKYLVVIILFIALTAVVPAQTQTVTAPTTPTVTTTVTVPGTPIKVVPFPGDKAFTEIFARPGQKVIKNAPFSAEGISESVQVLEDGNRIRRSVTTKMYRDGEGRFRRETTASTGGSGFGYSTYGGVISAYGFKDTISIFDPVAGVSYALNPTEKTARSFSVQPGKFTFNMTGPTITLANKAQIETKVKEAKEQRQKQDDEKKVETKVEVKPNVVVAPNVTVTGTGVGVGMGIGIGSGSGGFIYKGDGKTEQLGTKMIEGVEAEGTRTVTTIEAGKIGNERDIEITYERWFSKELDMIVYSRHYDPRSGEQVYKLVNIDRSEPDRSLFTVPADYKITTGSSMNVFTTPPTPTTKQQ